MSYWSSYVCSADLGAKGTVISAEEPIPSDITITTIRDGGAPVTETVTIAPVAPTNDSETRHLYGIEATASHAFTWLPDPLDGLGIQGSVNRSEEHTSELQSLMRISYAVFCLKKKKTQ